MRLKYIVTPEIKKLDILSTVVAEIYGVSIDRENQKLEDIKSQAASEVIKMSDEFIASNLTLQSYRNLVKNTRRSLRKFPPAAESLILSVRRTGNFPLINVAVDCYNIVVARRFLALGVHDMNKLAGRITFRLSNGKEPFTAVGSDKLKYTEPNDFVYADDNRVLAWLDSKDSDLVKISVDTKDIVIIIQGTDYTTKDYNYAAAQEACELITRFCGGNYEIQVLD